MVSYNYKRGKEKRKMKLYKISMITHYEIKAESLDEAFDKMTDENISDRWVDCYEEEDLGEEEENDKTH